MFYIKVLWNNDHPDDPIILYSELDEKRWEVRKVEVFRDNSMGYADRHMTSKDTGLGLMPVPPIQQISKDAEFVATAITKDQFEEVWRKATSSA